MKRLFWIVLFIIMCMGVSAAPWSQPGYDGSNRFYSNTDILSSIATYDNGTASYINVTQSHVAFGSSVPGVFLDIDNDTQIEFISTQGASWAVMSYSDSALNEEFTGTSTGGQMIQGSPVTLDDYNSDGYPEILFLSGSAAVSDWWIDIYQFNVTTGGYDRLRNKSYVGSGGGGAGFYPNSGIRCKNYVTGDTGWHCYFVTNAQYVFEYNISTNVYSIWERNAACAGTLNFFMPSNQSIISDDIDLDGKDELIFEYTCNLPATYYGLMSVDQDTNATDDYQDSPMGLGNNEFMYSISTVNINGGTKEILYTVIRENLATKPGYVVFLTSTMGLSSSWNIGTCNGCATGSYMISNPVYQSFYQDTASKFACAIYKTEAATANMNLTCINPVTGTVNNYPLNGNTYAKWWAASAKNVLLTAGKGYPGEEDMYTLFTGTHRITVTENNAISAAYPLAWNDTMYGSSVLFEDVDSDGAGELIMFNNSRTSVMSSGAGNSRPEIVGSYGQDSCGPACLGTYRTYASTECDPDIGYQPGCNYMNAVLTTDDERMVSGCGNSSAIVNGTWSDLQPTFSCYWNVIGTRVVRMYLQDNADQDDLSVYPVDSSGDALDIIVNVVNGTPGITCNLPCSYAASIPGGTPATTPEEAAIISAERPTMDEVLDDFWDTIFSGEAMLKAVLALFILSCSIAGLVKANIDNPLVYSIVIFGTLCITALIHLVSWLVVFIIGAVIFFIGIMGLVFGGNG